MVSVCEVAVLRAQHALQKLLVLVALLAAAGTAYQIPGFDCNDACSLSLGTADMCSQFDSNNCGFGSEQGCIHAMTYTCVSDYSCADLHIFLLCQNQNKTQNTKEFFLDLSFK